MAITAAQLMVKVGADTRGAETGLRRVQQQAAGFAAALGGMAIARTLFGGVQEAVVGFNASMEQSQIAWTTMLGSAQAAQGMLADLKTFARETPFDFPGIETASRRLLAMGFSAKEVIPLMTDVGNAASALGLGTEGINRLILALGQMRAKTKVSGEEMRQLTEAGVPAWEILAQAMNKSVAEVMKLSETGKIASQTFIQAFQTFSQQNYGGMMAAQSRTFLGAMSNIKDSLTQVASSAFAPLFARLSGLAQKFAEFASSETLQRWAARMQSIIEGVTALFARLPAPVRQGIGVFAGLAAAVALAVPLLALIGPALSALLGPIGLIIAAVAALYAAWKANLGGVRDVVAKVWPQVRDTLLRGVQGVVGWFQEQLPKLREITASVLGAIRDLWADYGGRIQSVVSTAWGAIQSTIQWAMDVIGEVINLTLKILKGDWEGAWESFKRILFTAWEGIIKQLAASAKVVLQIIGGVYQALGGDDSTGAWAAKIDEWAGSLTRAGAKALGMKETLGALKKEAKTWADYVLRGKQTTDAWGDSLGNLIQGNRQAAQGMGDFRQAEQAAAQGAQATALTFETLGSAANEAAVEVGDLSAALVRVHPASMAAAQSVAQWESQIAGVNAALEANQRAMRAEETRLAGMQEKLRGLNEQLSAAQQRLQELANPRLAGMGRLDMQINALEMHLKRVELASSLGRPLARLVEQYPLLTEGAEAWLATLPAGVTQSARALQRYLDQLRLTRSLTYDEQMRLLEESVSPTAPEMTFAGAMAEIASTKAEMETLSAQIAAQETVIAAQERAIARLRAEGERLNDTLRAWQSELAAAQQRQSLVNQALELAYNWFLRDRQEMVALGAEGVQQAAVVDAQARLLLGAVSQFASDTTSISEETLAGLIANFQASSSQAVIAVNLELAKIPTDIYTTHHIRSVYEGIGGAESIPGRASGGPVTAGRPYLVGEEGPELFVPRLSGAIVPYGGAQAMNVYVTVQGSVTAERDLAEHLRQELLRTGRRNVGVGLA